MKIIIQILLLFIWITDVSAQDVESIYSTLKNRWQHDPVKISGAIGINSTYFQAGNNPDYQLPFMYNLFGNINLDILGVQAPLGLFYSNKNSQYRLPAYHFIGISPSYKGQTLHLGDRNMSFGPYTFDGLGFSGVGAESEIGSFTIKAMYGRIQKATLRDVQVHNNLGSAYQRMAWAAGIGYKKDDLDLDFHLFHGADDIRSIPLANPDSVKPQSGTIMGLKAAKTIGPAKVYVDYAYNVHNADKTLLPLDGKHSLFGIFPGLQAYNNATGIYHAIKAGLDLNLFRQVISLNYERIDPGYQSLGTLYFNNDKETISGSLQTALWKNKINTVITLGTERNNLADDQINTYHRFVSAVNLAWRIDSKTSANATFSNFSFDQKSYLSTAPFIDVDTLVLTQNNLNFGTSILHQLGQSGQLSFQFSHNAAKALNNDKVNPNSKVSNYLASAGYVYSNQLQKMNLGALISYSKLILFSGQTLTFGPSFNISKKFFNEQLNSSFNTGYFLGKSNDVNTGILRLFWSNEYKWRKNINIGVQMMYVHSTGINKYNNFMVNALAQYTLESKTLIKTFSRKNSK